MLNPASTRCRSLLLSRLPCLSNVFLTWELENFFEKELKKISYYAYNTLGL